MAAFVKSQAEKMGVLDWNEVDYHRVFRKNCAPQAVGLILGMNEFVHHGWYSHTLTALHVRLKGDKMKVMQGLREMLKHPTVN